MKRNRDIEVITCCEKFKSHIEKLVKEEKRKYLFNQYKKLGR
jgi:hypothetical protein